MKNYCVTYSYRTSYDTTVKARNKKEAEAKVLEVIGDCRLEGTWEVRKKKNKDAYAVALP